MLDSRKIPFEVCDLFITEKGTIPGTQKQVDRMNKRALKDNPESKDLVEVNDTTVTIIREMICSIRVLGEFTNDEIGLVIGITQNEKGFIFGVGARVTICSNFTIMGANHIFRNYGKDGMDFSHILELIEKRIDNIKEFWQEQGAFINRLIMMRVPAITERNSILGSLLSLAVKGAYIDSTLEVPLNISECSKLAANMLSYDDKGDNLVPLWDFFNHITAVTSSSNRLEARIIQSAATGKFFTDRYRLGEIIEVIDLEKEDAENAKDIMEDEPTPNTLEEEDKDKSGETNEQGLP
jgi:hypothetical protein